ncbi:MAG: Lrp/AsnC family transcriptional regulator [Nitratireductor sp.]
MDFDKIDRSILRELQTNARIANVELADKVGLSQSACSRRVAHLEQTGVITGYQAVISNKAIGHTVTCIIHITLSSQSEKAMLEFEQAAIKCPYIVACFLMSGESDYIARVNAKDMEDFENVHRNWVSTLPHVIRIQTSFAMRSIVNLANVDISTIS